MDVDVVWGLCYLLMVLTVSTVLLMFGTSYAVNRRVTLFRHDNPTAREMTFRRGDSITAALWLCKRMRPFGISIGMLGTVMWDIHLDHGHPFWLILDLIACAVGERYMWKWGGQDKNDRHRLKRTKDRIVVTLAGLKVVPASDPVPA